jgi:hypothetical protein
MKLSQIRQTLRLIHDEELTPPHLPWARCEALSLINTICKPKFVTE